jgi:hypothetical protein
MEVGTSSRFFFIASIASSKESTGTDGISVAFAVQLA